MYLFSITLFLVLNTVISHDTYHKCCGTKSYLNKIDSVHECSESDQQRLQFLTNETDFLRKNTSGYCVDATKDEFVLYNITESEISESELIKDDVSPKCCPLNYVYDTVRHACSKSVTADIFDLIEDGEVFVKVGLTHCKVIVDYIFNSTDEFHRNDSTLYFLNKHETYSKGSYCLDRTADKNVVVRVCGNFDICKTVKCVNKCCPDGQSYVNGKKCLDRFENGLDLTFSQTIEKNSDPFAITHNLQCKKIHYLNESRYIFHMNEFGSLFIYTNLSNSYEEYRPENQRYCIEHAHTKGMNNFAFFRCLNEPEQKIKFTITKWVKFVSCVFLVLTILVYLLLPEIMNLFGKTLVNYCLAVLAAFIPLTYSQFSPGTGDILCQFLGYSAIFGTYSNFTWLNVMSFDIWWTLGSPKAYPYVQRRKELKRILIYLCYGWGIPLLFMLITMAFNKSKILPLSIHPYVGVYKCFITGGQGNYGDIVFLFVPLLLLQVVNTVLFFKTVTYCMKVKGEINKMNDTRAASDKNKRFQADKERLNLLVKLAVIMGISYVFEVISPFVSFEHNNFLLYLEVCWDTINCLQGVFIFIIFICKRKVFNTIKSKLGESKLRKISVSSTQLTSLTPKNTAKI